MANLHAIFRHPIKGHGREELSSVGLRVNEVLPYDRIWAVQHDAGKTEFSGQWISCLEMMRGARSLGLQAIEASIDETTEIVTLQHPDLGQIAIDPNSEQGQSDLISWTKPLVDPARAQSARVLRLDGHGFTDANFPSVSIMNMASLDALSNAAGVDVSIHRWRGNLWVDGWDAWAENDLVGKTIRIGQVELLVDHIIGRCKMTSADPETGQANLDSLGLLKQVVGETDFGIAARVTKAGNVAKGDIIEVL